MKQYGNFVLFLTVRTNGCLVHKLVCRYLRRSLHSLMYDKLINSLKLFLRNYPWMQIIQRNTENTQAWFSSENMTLTLHTDEKSIT
mmetsp:Transcript_21918/g.33449  ORF Transcript_21918/g.33449 Transcript_21918/m.33449 type:complete len:86 (+) Transcript_21918:644-901(+)